MKHVMNRRDFLAVGSLAATGLSLHAGQTVHKPGTTGAVVNLGIIGMGSRGGGIAGNIRRLPGTKVTACCDTLPDHLKTGLDRAGPQAVGYTDYRKLLEDKNVDGVIITLPQHLHYPAAKAALEAQKHVYLEKTMTHTISEALELTATVERHPHLVFQVGHQYRYFALYHRIFSMLMAGELGTVLQYECQYHRNADWRKQVPDPALERHLNWRMYREYSGGLMTELCSHQIDIVNWFTGSHPLRVTAIGGVDYWKDGRETYDNIRAIFEYPDGVKATASSILCNAYNGFSIRILGTKATVEVQQSSALLYYETRAKTHGVVDGVSGATADSRGQGSAIPITFDYQDTSKRNPTAYALLDFADCQCHRHASGKRFR